VVDALVKANKDFDLLIFPNARHGYGIDSAYMTRRRWDYFVRHLLGAEPPREYQIAASRADHGGTRRLGESITQRHRDTEERHVVLLCGSVSLCEPFCCCSPR
jgi:hypothetical protein